jgi:hypothetical protein
VPVNTTTWTKGVRFAGTTGEHLLQVSTGSLYNPLRMDGLSSTVTANSTSGHTSSDFNARPWMVTAVFDRDSVNTTQRIWNSGEGHGGANDNIYLEIRSGVLYFGMGRDADKVECNLGYISSSWDYGVYIGHKGQKYDAANATATNLANAFDIRIMSGIDGFTNSTEMSTTSNWNSGVTGGRMNRGFGGNFTIGGTTTSPYHVHRGNIGRVIVTTLPRNVAMPDVTQSSMMIKDPDQWVDTYKVGEPYRPSGENYNNANFSIGDATAAASCLYYEMGDGASDSFTNGIRNKIRPADATFTKLQFVNMANGRIVNMTFNGLS